MCTAELRVHFGKAPVPPQDRGGWTHGWGVPQWHPQDRWTHVCGCSCTCVSCSPAGSPAWCCWTCAGCSWPGIPRPPAESRDKSSSHVQEERRQAPPPPSPSGTRSSRCPRAAKLSLRQRAMTPRSSAAEPAGTRSLAQAPGNKGTGMLPRDYSARSTDCLLPDPDGAQKAPGAHSLWGTPTQEPPVQQEQGMLNEGQAGPDIPAGDTRKSGVSRWKLAQGAEGQGREKRES